MMQQKEDRANTKPATEMTSEYKRAKTSVEHHTQQTVTFGVSEHAPSLPVQQSLFFTATATFASQRFSFSTV